MSVLPDIKARVVAQLPPAIQSGLGVSISKTAGRWRFELDYDNIQSKSSLPSAEWPDSEQLYWNKTTKEFTRVPYINPSPRVTGTSTTSADLTVGNKNFSVESGIGWIAGMRLRGSDQTNPKNYFEGVVSSYDSDTGALSIDVESVSGSGTVTSWYFGVAGERPVTSALVGSFSSITTIAALDTSSYNAVNLTEPLRQGAWSKALYADYAADVAADVNNGYVIRSTDDPDYVWVRDVSDGRYQVDWFRTKGANKAANTAAVKAAIESIPSGSKLVFSPLAQYDLNEISATTRGHIHIDMNGACITNTTQIATYPDARPILRVFARTGDYNVVIENGIIEGPRLSSSTTVPTGGYGGDPLNPGPGNPSGIDVPIGRNIRIKNMIVSGAYHTGIEAHYANDILVEDSTVYNCGYAGMLLSDSEVARAVNNNVDDIGAYAPTYGYGIGFSTSYNSPSYTHGLRSAIAIGNHVTRCKRKPIDVHDGLSVIITDNYIKGFGYCAIYAVGEGAAKNVGDTIVANNQIYGDPSFLGGAIDNSVIWVGPSDGAISDASINIQNNHISGVSAPLGIQISSPTSGSIVAQSVAVIGNTFDKSTFIGQAIRSFGGAKTKSVLVANNVINADVSSPHIYITNAIDALVTGNVCRGVSATSTVAQFTDVTNAQSINNMLNGVLGA